MSDEKRGSGITTKNTMKRLQDLAAESYSRALDTAGVKGPSKATNEESFKAGMRAMVHHMKELGIVVMVPEPEKVS